MTLKPQAERRFVPRRFHPESMLGPIGWFVLLVALVMLVGAILAQTMQKVPTNPRWREAQALAEPVVSVVRAYKRERGMVPPDLPGLVLACQAAGLTGEALPSDPWGRPLGYVPDDTEYHAPYLVSWGADGQEGGGQENQDIRIWAGEP